MVLAAGLAPALSTFSTSCLCVGLREQNDGASRRSCTGKVSLQKKSAGCCGEAFHNGRHANASQSPVLPRAWLAYDACLNAGSTAVLAHGHHSETGAPIRSCTELFRLPSECIADNALGAMKLASLTGFAPVISCMRGRHVDWATPQGQKW